MHLVKETGHVSVTEPVRAIGRGKVIECEMVIEFVRVIDRARVTGRGMATGRERGIDGGMVTSKKASACLSAPIIFCLLQRRRILFWRSYWTPTCAGRRCGR